MPDRLDKIVTRGGDRGETSLGDGTRLPKDDLRIALLGDLDELNCAVGAARTEELDAEIDATLEGVQHDLFDLGGALSFPGAPLLKSAHVDRLDKAAAALNADLPPLKEFILPGGSRALAALHLARTIARRVERAMAAFARDHAQTDEALQYLNRLSDYLFIAARAEAKRAGVAEVYWRKDASLSAT